MSKYHRKYISINADAIKKVLEVRSLNYTTMSLALGFENSFISKVISEGKMSASSANRFKIAGVCLDPPLSDEEVAAIFQEKKESHINNGGSTPKYMDRSLTFGERMHDLARWVLEQEDAMKNMTYADREEFWKNVEAHIQKFERRIYSDEYLRLMNKLVESISEIRAEQLVQGSAIEEVRSILREIK